MKFVVILLVVLGGWVLQGCGACVDDANVKKAVEKQGYSEVRLTDKSIFFITFRGCSKEDSAKYSARAKNPKGKEVDLIICAGWPFKGVTVRTE